MTEVASAYVSLIPSYRGGTRTIASQLAGPADSAGRQAGRRYGTGLLSSLSGMKGAVTGVVGGMLAFQGVSKGIGFAKDAIFGFNSQLEQSTIAFTTMLGSGRKAQTFLNQLKAFAKSTPFEFPDLVHASQKLIAMGIASKDVIPYMTGIGDAVAGLGGGAQQIDQVTTAIGQMSAKGKIQSDELLQLTEAGIPALKILADSYGVTTAEMQNMVTKGQVLSSKALPALIAGLENGTKSSAAFGGMMDKQSHTFGGAMSNIKDSLQQSLATAFLPFFNQASGGLQRLATWLSGPQFAAASAKFTAGLATGMQFLSANMPKVIDVFRGVWSVAGPVIVALGGAFLNALKQAGSAVAVLSGFLADNKSTLAGVGSAIADVLKVLAPFAPYVVGAFAAFKGAQAATQGVSNLKDRITAARDTVVEWRDNIKSGVSAVKKFGSTVKGGADTVRLWAMYSKESASAALANVKAVAASSAAYVKNGVVAAASATRTVALAIAQRAAAAGSAAMTAATWLLNAAMEVNPVVLVVTALIALGVAFAVAWKKSATFRTIVTGAFNAIKAVVIVIADYFTKVLPAAFRAVVSGLRSAWNAVVGFLKTWGPRALLVLAPFIGIPLLIARHFGEIKAKLAAVWSSVLGTGKRFVSNIVSAISGIPGAIGRLAGKVLDAGKHLMGSFWSGMKHGIGSVGDFVADIGSAIRSGINHLLHLPIHIPKINTHIPGIGTVGGQTLIPALAKGGIINPVPGGRLVRVAEAGQAEAVIPLNRFKDFGLNGGDGGSSGPLIGELNINEVSDPVGTARAVSRRVAMLGAV